MRNRPLRPAGTRPTLAMILMLLPLGGCSDMVSPAPPSSASSTAAPAGYETELEHCVSITNAYRASVGRSALSRAPRLEAYAVKAARHDAAARKAHQYVAATNFGNGLVRAENELLRWPLSTYGTVRRIVEAGLAEMWREGVGGGHYTNMIGDYREIGCGISVSNGKVTLAQAFR